MKRRALAAGLFALLAAADASAQFGGGGMRGMGGMGGTGRRGGTRGGDRGRSGDTKAKRSPATSRASGSASVPRRRARSSTPCSS
jgi:hypothetical protein